MNIERISWSWRNIAPLLVPAFSEENCDRLEITTHSSRDRHIL